MPEPPGATTKPSPTAEPDRPAAGFDAFYRSDYAAVVALAYALCGRGAIAEDIAQEAFMVAHQRWRKVGGYDKPGAYVRRVAANMAVSQRRRLAAEGRAKARLALRSRSSEEAGDVPDPAFWRAVRSLPRRQAQVIALHYLEDRSAEDVAQIIGCSPATVRVHLHRGRQALEQMLGGGREP